MLVVVSVAVLYLTALMSFFGAAILRQHRYRARMFLVGIGAMEFIMATALALIIAR